MYQTPVFLAFIPILGRLTKMPVLITVVLGARDTVPQSQSSKDPETHTISNTVLGIVLAVVGGIILIGTILSFVLIRYTRRRQYRRVKELEPYLTREEFFKRRKMTSTEIFREEEEQRRQMIRKSLASRSTMSMRSESSAETTRTATAETMRTTATTKEAATADQVDLEIAEMGRRASAKYKEDWKRWQAIERRVRALSSGQHPVVSKAGGVPILAIPCPTKHRSHGRMSLTNPPPSPPIPARHPGRRASR